MLLVLTSSHICWTNFNIKKYEAPEGTDFILNSCRTVATYSICHFARICVGGNMVHWGCTDDIFYCRRVEWSTTEDNLLLLCKVACMYLCPTPRKQVVTFPMIRDHMHQICSVSELQRHVLIAWNFSGSWLQA
jgi:hypothetical protein